MAESYLVTPDVVRELRDKKGREVLAEAEIQLQGLPGGKAGFIIREPSLEAVIKGEHQEDWEELYVGAEKLTVDLVQSRRLHARRETLQSSRPPIFEFWHSASRSSWRRTVAGV
jgi:hypothetical protein